MAYSLARSGVTVLGLWDEDIIEPGNICRSCYHIDDIGESKVIALAKEIAHINPFINTYEIVRNGHWVYNNSSNINVKTYLGGAFYGNVNYNDQEKSINQIKQYDLIIDCTGSNELLHFLSYALPDSHIISLCITNHSNELLCVTNRDGNPFELRKAYLSRIEQDTRNFFMEGSGCYSPTFLATYSDIASLLNLCLKELNKEMEKGELMHSLILSHNERGILIDRLVLYELEGYEISMTVPKETLLDAEEMDDVPHGPIGYVLGSYSKDGKQIMVTHIVEASNARESLTDAYNTSNGIIDYIGDYTYSGEEQGSYGKEALVTISNKAADESINTNNPLLVVRNPDRSISFFLFINNGLVPFRCLYHLGD